MSGVDGEGYTVRQIQLVAVTSTCLFVSTVVVALRLFVRHLTAGNFWWDDYFAVAALVRNASFFMRRRQTYVQIASILFSQYIHAYWYVSLHPAKLSRKLRG